MLPSTTKEQRGPMYEDLLPLITPGFLTARLTFGGVSLGLRSLSANDLSFLRLVAREGGPEWPLHVAAASIWMVDGTPLLEGHPYIQKEALKILKSLHKSVARAVFAQSLGFFRRMKRANRFFESFLYEEESRRLWKGTNNGAYPLWTQAGIPGLERLGMNPFQASWVLWNRGEDDRLDDDYEWSMTKVLVSVQSSKSAKKLDGKDKARTESERSRRSEVQNLAFQKFLGAIDDEGKGEANPLYNIHQPRTPAELSEEMRRWVAGEKDFHDEVVEGYKNRVKVGYENREREEAERIERARRRREEEEALLGVSKPSLKAFTPDEFEKRKGRREFPGARFIHEASPIARTFNRYVRDLPDPGALEVRDGRVVYKDTSTDPVSESSPVPSVNDLIANRKPRLNG